ncbi:hypothetical protein BD413DRAFT_445792, partial [Trametes elegans]
LFSPHVHFPPTPRIADTYPAHSPTTYDRAPIAVSPNICQLPRRGERKVQSPPADCEADRRGRTRARSKGPGSGPGSGEAVKGSYFHPRAYEACMPEPPSSAPPSAAGTRARVTFDDSPSPPALVADLSPSDESDESVTTPP